VLHLNPRRHVLQSTHHGAEIVEAQDIVSHRHQHTHRDTFVKVATRHGLPVLSDRGRQRLEYRIPQSQDISTVEFAPKAEPQPPKQIQLRLDFHLD
jgi:hypothetical protein